MSLASLARIDPAVIIIIIVVVVIIIVIFIIIVNFIVISISISISISIIIIIIIMSIISQHRLDHINTTRPNHDNPDAVVA